VLPVLPARCYEGNNTPFLLPFEISPSGPSICARVHYEHSRIPHETWSYPMNANIYRSKDVPPTSLPPLPTQTHTHTNTHTHTHTHTHTRTHTHTQTNKRTQTQDLARFACVSREASRLLSTQQVVAVSMLVCVCVCVCVCVFLCVCVCACLCVCLCSAKPTVC
jgi:hypothetical protein